MAYLKSAAGLLKILEIILLIICVGSVGYYWDKWAWKDFDSKREGVLDEINYIKNFIYATATAGGIEVLFFLLFVCELHENIKALAIIGGVIFFLLGIMLFVVTGFLAYAYRQYNVGYVCDVLELWKQDSQCEQLLAGTVCGGLAGLIMIVNSIIHCCL